MFIVIGIFSILAGCFAFSQVKIMIVLSSLSDSMWHESGFSLMVSLLLILAGALSIASYDGERKQFVACADLAFMLSFFFAVINYNSGFMPVWTFFSVFMIFLYSIWIFRHPDQINNSSETESFIDPELSNKDEDDHDNNTL